MYLCAYVHICIRRQSPPSHTHVVNGARDGESGGGDEKKPVVPWNVSFDSSPSLNLNCTSRFCSRAFRIRFRSVDISHVSLSHTPQNGTRERRIPVMRIGPCFRHYRDCLKRSRLYTLHSPHRRRQHNAQTVHGPREINPTTAKQTYVLHKLASAFGPT